VFDVRVDGALVFSKRERGRFPVIDDVLPSLTKK